jgi:hypothetical protein
VCWGKLTHFMLRLQRNKRRKSPEFRNWQKWNFCIVLVMYILYFHDIFHILLSRWLNFESVECMCVGMYVCMYVCRYVRTYVCMYVCMYVCTYVCMYVGMYVRTYVCMYVCMYACMHVCTYVCTYACMCICIRQ